MRCFQTAVVLLCVGLPAQLHAQAAAGEERQTTIVFYTENDDWPPDTGTDKNYTNAFRLTLERNYDMWGLRKRLPALFGWVPGHPDCSTRPTNPDDKCVSTSWHVLGQQFYTPDDITIAELIPTDRPYAGWLYVGGSWKASTESTLVASDVYIGFTGKASLGETVQSFWHGLVDAPDPKGWDHQIGGRLGIVVGHSRYKAFDALAKGKRWLELVPYAGGTLGNIITDGYGGARLKVGYNLSRDWSQTGIGTRVREPGVVPEAGNFELYVVVDGQGRALAYNAFIDAAPAHTLNRQYLVADSGVGFGFRVKRFSASYRIAFVTPEYKQALVHDYKALRFMITLK